RPRQPRGPGPPQPRLLPRPRDLPALRPRRRRPATRPGPRGAGLRAGRVAARAMAGDDQDQGPAAPDPGRLPPAERARLDALHQLAPLAGRRLLLAHAFLFAAAADA